MRNFPKGRGVFAFFGLKLFNPKMQLNLNWLCGLFVRRSQMKVSFSVPLGETSIAFYESLVPENGNDGTSTTTTTPGRTPPPLRPPPPRPTRTAPPPPTSSSSSEEGPQWSCSECTFLGRSYAKLRKLQEIHFSFSQWLKELAFLLILRILPMLKRRDGISAKCLLATLSN